MLTTTAVADDWNTAVGGNSSRDGISREIGPTSPNILWSGSLSGIVAQQAAIGDGIVVVNRIESFTIPTGTWIVAHDLDSGETLWEEQLPYDFPGTSWRSRATAVRNGLVYATRSGNTNEDYLYAMDVVNGDIVWRSEDLIDEASTESPAFTSNGDLIVGNFRSLMRIDRTDGRTVWSSPRTTPTTNGAQAAVFGEHVYIFESGPHGPVISAFDINTGLHLYSTEGIGGGIVQQVGPFVGPDGTVYAPRTQNNVATDFLVAFEDTGSGFVEKWRRPIGYVPFASFGVGPDGSVYSYETDRDNEQMTILRLDPTDGSVIDTSIHIQADFSQPRMAIDAAGMVYFTNGGFSKGAVYCFEPDLTMVWTEPMVNVNVGGPAIGPDGTMVVCGVGTDVRAYRTTDGLTLNGPEPGIAGLSNRFNVRGAQPNSTVALAYGRRQGSTPVPGCPAVFVDIHQAVLAGIARSDSRGKAAVTRVVPPAATDLEILLQAVTPADCQVSNLIKHKFLSGN
jgi:outer membrane protein assembly factor BamB